MKPPRAAEKSAAGAESPNSLPASATRDVPGSSPEDRPTSRPELESSVKDLNTILGQNTELRFEVSEESGKLVVAIVDSRSHEVIKTIPPSELDNMRSRLARGSMLIDDRT